MWARSGKHRKLGAMTVVLAACLAAGCRNGATREDPFLQRRLVPAAPMGSYAPAAGGTYYPPGAPVLQPVPGPTSGASQAAPAAGGSGEIVPASAVEEAPSTGRGAMSGTSDGWAPKNDR